MHMHKRHIGRSECGTDGSIATRRLNEAGAQRRSIFSVLYALLFRSIIVNLTARNVQYMYAYRNVQTRHPLFSCRFSSMVYTSWLRNPDNDSIDEGQVFRAFDASFGSSCSCVEEQGAWHMLRLTNLCFNSGGDFADFEPEVQVFLYSVAYFSVASVSKNTKFTTDLVVIFGFF